MAEKQTEKLHKNFIIKYLSEVKTEMTKVVWPTKKQVINNTILVIVISILVAAILGGLDILFTNILTKLLET